MQYYLGLVTLTVMTLVTPKVYAHQVNLKLAPKSSKVVTNHFGWTLNANCTIQAKSQNKIRFSVMDNKGTVNGSSLSSGQAKSVVVHNNDSISVSAEPGTTVTLENLGEDPVQATCEA